jgi:hypothetical protein
VVVVTLSTKTTILLSFGGETSEFSVLVHRVADPVDPWIISDGIVCRVYKDNLVVLVGRVLIEPVGVNNPKASQFATSTFLSNRSLTTLEFELCHSLVGGFTVHDTLRHWPLASTTSDSNTVDNKPLLGLVAETTSLVGTSGTNKTNNGRLLAILPTPNPLKKPHHIRLLLPP